jgi:hypothetical protein
VDALGAVGTVPSLAPGLSAFARVGKGTWSLAVELRADAAESAGRPAELGGGQVQARLYAASIVPCYHRGYVAVCIVGMAGTLEASGDGVTPAHAATTAFAATGVRLGVEWPLSATFGLRAGVDGIVNLDPVTLALGEDGKYSVWSAPRFAGTLSSGLIVQFP